MFSYWKTTLHLLARLLRAAGVVYLQVDGDTSFVERSGRLKAFKEESNAYVLLMTVGTGAVGYDFSCPINSSRTRAFHGFTFGNNPADLLTLTSLNLTVASQVHIIEPQWNPSVEEQAVARAVRMGQKREVTIYRYILQNTVEQVSHPS